MEDLERVQTRLTNLESVQPILSAMRTVSLGRWQTALHHQRRAQQYLQRLRLIRAYLADQQPAPDLAWAEPPVAGSRLVVAVGSNRGLCGQFNKLIVAAVAQHLAEHNQAGSPPAVIALGKRLTRQLEANGLALVESAALPRPGSGLVSLAFALTEQWQRHHLAEVTLIHNVGLSGGRYETRASRLLPLSRPKTEEEDLSETAWPPPIIETDSVALHNQVMAQWQALILYDRLLESQAVEHAARFQLMEAANQNTERLSDELKIMVQAARRQAITRETQALAVGAGLLGPQLD